MMTSFYCFVQVFSVEANPQLPIAFLVVYQATDPVSRFFYIFYDAILNHLKDKVKMNWYPVHFLPHLSDNLGPYVGHGQTVYCCAKENITLGEVTNATKLLQVSQ